MKEVNRGNKVSRDLQGPQALWDQLDRRVNQDLPEVGAHQVFRVCQVTRAFQVRLEQQEKGDHQVFQGKWGHPDLQDHRALTETVGTQDHRDVMDYQVPRDQRAPLGHKVRKDPKECQEKLDLQDQWDHQDPQAMKDAEEPKGTWALKDFRENLVHRGQKDQEDIKDHRDHQGHPVMMEIREI